MKNPFTLSFNDSREKAEFKAAKKLILASNAGKKIKIVMGK